MHDPTQSSARRLSCGSGDPQTAPQPATLVERVHGVLASRIGRSARTPQQAVPYFQTHADAGMRVRPAYDATYS
jgi:hypothetical protein